MTGKQALGVTEEASEVSMPSYYLGMKDAPLICIPFTRKIDIGKHKGGSDHGHLFT